MQQRLAVLCNAVFSLIVLGLASTPAAAAPPGSAYLDGGQSSYALLLCHGRGKHPTWKVVDPLRRAVHQELGYHTLSLQMPATNQSFDTYANDFPQAYATIRAGIDFLRQEKNVSTIYLMGHSMGARMSSAFIAEFPEAPIRGLIVAGIYNNGNYPLSGKLTLNKVKIPVLDIFGDGEAKDIGYARERVDLLSEHYRQVMIPGADHRFDGHERAFTDAVIAWLKQHQP